MPMDLSSTSPVFASTATVLPDKCSSMDNLKLSASDLPMLSCHYIQKGCLYAPPPFPINGVVSIIRRSLSRALSFFPPLAGRLTTDAAGNVYITSNDAGVDFIHAIAHRISLLDVLSPVDVPDFVKEFFHLDLTVSHAGHTTPLLAVQVTELADGFFIGCTANHAVVDGTSFWNFFNSFAEVSKGAQIISKPAEFRRESILISSAVLKFPAGGPIVSFSFDEPLRERVFSFSAESIQELKARANNRIHKPAFNELLSKQENDTVKSCACKMSSAWRKGNPPGEISSFQSLCALVWLAVTRARKLPPSKTTTFRMAVNCRLRLKPRLHPYYFGNAIQSIPTYASAGDVTSRDLRWSAQQLNRNVASYDEAAVRRALAEWERDPRCFPLGNLDGAMITMGSSPRFPMYDNDFGWGRPLAVRSGRANKFDGKMSAFPGREGDGSVDMEICLCPETMAALEKNSDFMYYVSE